MTEKPIVIDKIWFNPVNVIYEFKRLQATGVLNSHTKGYKRIQEAYISAISLVGMIKVLKIDFWLQIVDDAEESPDVRTICFTPKGLANEFSIQDVEVTIFGQHSKGSITDFLLTTKLSNKKGYDDFTNILCLIDQITSLPPAAEIQKILHEAKLNKKSPVILLGKIHQDKEIYRMVQVYPDQSIDVEFDLEVECKQIKYPGGLKLGKRGRKGEVPKIIYDGTQIYPFDKFGLK